MRAWPGYLGVPMSPRAVPCRRLFAAVWSSRDHLARCPWPCRPSLTRFPAEYSGARVDQLLLALQVGRRLFRRSRRRGVAVLCGVDWHEW